MNASGRSAVDIPARPVGALRAMVTGLHQAISSAELQKERLERSYRNLRTQPPQQPGNPVPGLEAVPNTLEAELNSLGRRLDVLNKELAELADGFDAAL
jgi:hypothetical protein